MKKKLNYGREKRLILAITVPKLKNSFEYSII